MSRNGVRQEQVLAALAAYWHEHGISPSLRELAEAVGVASPSTIAWHLRHLEKAWKVTSRGGQPRTLRLVEQPETVKT